MPSSLRRLLLVVIVVGGVVAVVGVVAFRRTPMTGNEPAFPDVRFVDVTGAAGIHFRHVSGAAGKKLLPETMGSGVAVLDFDRDGWPDLFFVNSRPWPGHPGGRATQSLYRNRGDGTFEDVTAKSGLDGELYGMGAAVGDLDNDGFPDLLVTAVGGNRLYVNRGGKRFEDITDRAGVAGPAGWPEVDATAFLKWDRPVAFPSSATFLDFDGDGKLDLFVCYYLSWSPAFDLGVNAVLVGGQRAYVPPQQFPGTHCALYRNVDGTRFEDVSESAGVRVSEMSGPVAKALGVVACDPDRDGWTDLIVANDTVRNFFFHNVPAPGRGRHFREIGLTANVAYAEGRPRGGMGIDATELRPGQMAAVIANFSNEPNTLLRLSRTDPLLFEDTALAEGLAGPSRGPMKFGALFFDFDLDGRADLLTANGHLEPDITRAQSGQTHAQPAQLFRTNPDSFVPVTAEQVGADLFLPMVGRGCATLDFDGDGDLDLVLTANNGLARLLRNDNKTGNAALVLELVGDGRTTNRDAIGAEVRVEVGGETRRWLLAGARGYLSQSEHAVTVGLAPGTEVARISVRWPGDIVPQEWPGLPAGGRYRLMQGQSEAARVDRK